MFVLYYEFDDGTASYPYWNVHHVLLLQPLYIDLCSLSHSTAASRHPDEDCKNAIRNRKHALQTLRKHPHQQNIDLFRISRAKTCRVIRKAKRESWQNFISTLNPNTHFRHIWNAINKF